MKISFLLVTCLLLSIALQGQNWKKVLPSDVRNTGERQIQPNDYILAEIDLNYLQDKIAKAPAEGQSNARNSLQLEVMLRDGSIDLFNIESYKMMEEGLARQFPEIKTLIGKSTTNPMRRIRADWTEKGFRAVITDETGSTYIDPYQTGDLKRRIIYKRTDLEKKEEWTCGTASDNAKIIPSTSRFAGDCTLRQYRLAVAATAEYTTFHGGTVALGQAAIVTSINRVNEMYEQDLAVRFILVANNNLLVYTNANTDPYTNNVGGDMLPENQTNIDNVIGNANYDIGHVYSTGGGGVATLRSLCTDGSKARGVTGQGSPVGDPFDIDYVCHEIGHQFGGNHTQNNSCQRNSATAMEPGSASTIMGYAGICSPNVQNNSDPYFHAISIQEMTAHITGAGNCGVNVNLSNNPPILSNLINYTVPNSTPLVLEASASDADSGDELLYCWEQMDNEVATMPPVATNNGGPAFRSLSSTTSPNRYLPNLQAILNNQTPTWEVLPSVAREMNFRVTVRDHFESVGCTDEKDMQITVAGNSGPFIVTNSSIPSVVNEGQLVNVEWDVAGTNLAPVNCNNVDIKMSTDGGLTYPFSLAVSTPNDGVESVVIPAGLTTTARIMVRGSDNIFFDVNDANFAVEAGTNSFTIDLNPTSLEVCATANASFTINSAQIGTFTTPINLNITGIPANTTVNYSANPILPGQSTQVTLSNFGNNSGTFTLDVVATAGSETRTSNFELSLLQAADAPVLLSPSNSANGVDIFPQFSWSAVPGASSYNFQLSTQPNGGNIIENLNTTATSFVSSSALDFETTYYWRVSTESPCGNTGFSSDFSFSTRSACQVFTASGLPLDIQDNAQTDAFINVSGLSGVITDVNVVNLSGTHTFVSDLFMAIFGPETNPTQVNLFVNICGDQDDFDLGFDDEAGSTDISCPPTTGQIVQPLTPFSTWDGIDPNGEWQLGLLDLEPQDTGTLQSWGLEICTDGGNTCALNVTTTAASGPGSLLDAINCALSGDVITLDPSLSNQNIDLGTNRIIINKNLTIESNLNDNIGIDYSGTSPAIQVLGNNTLTLKGTKINQN